MSISATLEVITPQLAEEYLKSNSANYRKLSNAKVDTYTKDMKAGNWQENGEGIVFSENGTLKDGQHRLMAIVRSGVTVPMLVVRGVDDSVQVYDWGMNRTSRQIANACGYTIGTDGIGAAKVLISGFHQSAPKGIVNKYLEEHHEQLHEAGLIARRGGGSRSIGKKASCCLAVYVVRRLGLINDSILEEFFYIFNNGSVLPQQMRDPSPALVASRTFITKYASGSGNSQTYQYITVMQAMEDYKKNKNRRVEYKLNAEKPIAYLNQLRALDGIKQADI